MNGPRLWTWFYAGSRSFIELQTNGWCLYFAIYHMWFGGLVLKWQWCSGTEWRHRIRKDGWVVWLFEEPQAVFDTGYQILAPGEPYYGQSIEVLEECIWTMEE